MVDSDEVKALSRVDFAALMEPFGCLSHLAIGVSGGPDSMALLALARDWGIDQGVRVSALTVDHQLRAEAPAEAKMVAAWCRANDVAHETLVWKRAGEHLCGNVQAQARQARYTLMGNWCAAQGVDVLAVAHHADDQAETLLLRLARGSGVDGLAAMAVVADWPVVVAGKMPKLIRPLLSCSRAQLLATARLMQLPYVEDPSNDDLKYDRVKVRKSLEALGLDPARLGKTAALMAEEKLALEWATKQAFAQSVQGSAHGFLILDKAAFAALPPSLALRLLRHCIGLIARQDYPPRRVALERLRQAILAGAGHTLAGTQFVPGTSGWIYIGPEHLPDDLQAKGEFKSWDSRYDFACEAPGWRITARGKLPAAELSKEVIGQICSLPASVRAAVPVAVGPAGESYLPTFLPNAGPVRVHNRVYAAH